MHYTRNEVLADGFVHLLGVVGGLIAVTALLTFTALTRDSYTVAVVAVYGVGTIAVFVFSALYNLDVVPTRRDIMRRLDHAAIFVKIAGTYTPFVTVSLGGVWGMGLLGAVWIIAAVGVPLQLLAPDRLERISVLLYLLQGWLIVVAVEPLSQTLSGAAMTLIVIGGGLYTIGVGFHLATKLPYHNAIWHAFVLVASACMYAAVWIGVAAA